MCILLWDLRKAFDEFSFSRLRWLFLIQGLWSMCSSAPTLEESPRAINKTPQFAVLQDVTRCKHDRLFYILMYSSVIIFICSTVLSLLRKSFRGTFFYTNQFIPCVAFQNGEYSGSFWNREVASTFSSGGQLFQ